MKIAVFGTIPFSDLIKEGFKKLGHEISNKDPDLIFANDPTGYQDAAFCLENAIKEVIKKMDSQIAAKMGFSTTEIGDLVVQEIMA